MNNKKTGNDFEAEFAKLLSRHGFWVYNTVNKASGQPADIIACIHSTPYLIDCKVCENDVFRLSRIEDNQRYAMTVFLNCNNGRGAFFALKFKDGSIYLCHASTLFVASNCGVKSLSKKDIKTAGYYGMKLDDWLDVMI